MLKNRSRTGFLVIALAAMLAFGVTAYIRTAEATKAENLLRSGYDRSLYEGAELMRSAESNLQKLAVSNSREQSILYLMDIARQSQGAETALASLPTQDGAHAVMKAVNQTGDFADSLARRMIQGEAMTESERATIDRLITLTGHVSELLNAETDHRDAVKGLAGFDESDFAQMSKAEEAGEYPTLIYDGPFSDALQEPGFKALGSTTVDEEEALAILRRFFEPYGLESIRYDGVGKVPIEAHIYDFKSGEYAFSAAVTKLGGKLLYLICEDEIDSASLTISEAVNKAHAFLENRGYGDMRVCYYYLNQNVLTVNLAGTQGNVLLYPDLVKIQVSMKEGRVIGAEWINYLKNHEARALPEPILTENEAIEKLNPALTPEQIRVALIPLESEEILTYEIGARDAADNQYLVYIDADDGSEKQIYQLIESENGALVW